MGDGTTVVMTIVCGDNYAVEHQEEVTAAVLEKIRASGADLFVAGPCFDAGRYGMAAGALCSAVQSELGIPVDHGDERRESRRRSLPRSAPYHRLGNSITKLREIVASMAKLGKKLVAKEPIGLPAEEGYLQPRPVARSIR